MEGLTARAYIRVSTEEQAATGYSLPAQRERLEAFAKSQGWTVAKVYEDDGYSAKDTRRPALQQLLKDAQPSEVVLVYKLDRLTRSVLDLYALMKRFEERKVLFKSATEEFNTTTPHGRLMITLVAVLAQWERETIVERVKMGRQKKAASGEWPGGPIPFGYISKPGRQKARRILIDLIPDPDRAHLVREIFDRYVAGQGVRGLCLWLNDELGVRTAKGGRWRVTGMVRVLTNPIYCGDVVHGRRIEGPITRVLGNHEPIVPREVFEAVQRAFLQRKELPPRHATGIYPLSGVARCGVCGGAISTMLSMYEGMYYYRCLNYVQGVGCGEKALTSFPGPLAERMVVEEIADLQQPERLDAFLEECEEKWTAKLGLDVVEIRRLESDLQDARMAISRWDFAYETGKMEFEDYLKRVQSHKERINTIQSQLERVKAKPAPPDRETLAMSAVDFKRVWELAQPAERKALLLRFMPAFGGKIVLHRHRRVTLVPNV